MIKNMTDRNTKTDIHLILKTADGKKPLSSGGLADPRLLTGENKLHAIMDTQTCLWHMRQDHGLLPQPLRQQFTGFTKLLNFVKDYYSRRNIVVDKIID